MHWYGGGWFFGMHFLWWLFWVALVVLLFRTLKTTSTVGNDETPTQILQRRYASGEISTEEYEERKKHLESRADKG